MVGAKGEFYRCYGDAGGYEIKKDIGRKLSKTSPEWCPDRKKVKHNA
jgi:hypothetical protein